MKVLVALALATLAYARSVEELPRTTAHGYIKNIAIPLAEEIEKAEAKLTHNRIISGSPSQLGQFPYQVIEKPLYFNHFVFLLFNINFIMFCFIGRSSCKLLWLKW